MNIKKIVSRKKYPSFIRQHNIFTKYPQIKKIFQSIGLKNCKEPAIKYSQKDHKIFLQKVNRNINIFVRQCAGFSTTYKYATYNVYGDRVCSFPSLEDISKKNSLIQSLRTIQKHIFDKEAVKNGEMVLSCDIVPYKKGQSLVNVLHSIELKLNNLFRKNEQFDKIRDYSLNGNSLSLDIENCDIIFSSDKEDGIWDIATMSMRGISSCQSWTGCYNTRLIGSIIDPCCGILYLTKKTLCGKNAKMLARALVRYITKNGKKALLIERIYPTIYCGYGGYRSKYPELKQIFADFLKEKTGGKFPIFTSKPKGYSIPLTKPVKDLPIYCRSYRDSHIGYGRKLIKLA